MTADRLTPQREAEYREAVAALDADRTLSLGTWTASPISGRSVVPPEQSFVVEDVLHTESAVFRCSVAVFGDERHARFTALARTAVSELLAELAAVRAERDEARARAADAVEYGIADELAEQVLDPTWSRVEAERRLAYYADMGPVHLVQRSVSYGEWTEAAR